MKRKIKILIDPGHGGCDVGAVGNISQEKDIALLYALNLYFELLNDGNFEPYITRNRDVYVTLNHRVLMAKEYKVDGFVSIHCNSFTKEDPNDSQIYYYNKNKDKPFADMVFEFIDDIDGKHSKWSGVKYGNYQVLRDLNDTNISAILIELGFMSNSQDEELLNSLDFQQKMVKMIYFGIKSYFFA